MRAQPDPLIMQLLRALGAPDHVRSFELRAAVGECVTVRLDYFPEENGRSIPEAVLQEYDLVRRGPRAAHERVADRLAQQAQDEIADQFSALRRAFL